MALLLKRRATESCFAKLKKQHGFSLKGAYAYGKPHHWAMSRTPATLHPGRGKSQLESCSNQREDRAKSEKRQFNHKPGLTHRSCPREFSRSDTIHLRLPDGRPFLFWVLVLVGACQSGTVWAGLCLIHHHQGFSQCNCTIITKGQRPVGSRCIKKKGVTRLFFYLSVWQMNFITMEGSLPPPTPSSAGTVHRWLRNRWPL